MKLEYIDHMGDDSRTAEAARTSFDKSAADYSDEKNERLTKYLAREEHVNPFFHAKLSVVMELPIWAARQLATHKVGFERSEVSRRYVDYAPSTWSPSSWRKRPEKGIKQGSGEELPAETQQAITLHYEQLMLDCQRTYNWMLEKGVAPEQARVCLPQSMNTRIFVTGSLYAWYNMYRLRTKPNAQKDLAPLMAQLNDIMAERFPKTWEALLHG